MLKYIDFNKLGVLLKYDQYDPLIFTTSLFFFFFIVVLLLYRAASPSKTLRTIVLIAASFFFYYKIGNFFVFLLAASTLYNYGMGIAIEKSKGLTRKILFYKSILINIGVLGYFKYTNFFIDIFNQVKGTENPHLNILLPIGISFYTFKLLSYLVEIYWETIPAEKNILDFTLYVTFFANISAGPIERANNFLPQVKEKYYVSKELFNTSLFLIILGVIKKVVVADYIGANFVDRVFQWPTRYTGIENLLAVYGYTLQIYCDFSGYTDIALGLAGFLGYKLMINFNYPYHATSVADFWRRWHISLSSWLQDYLFKPIQLSARRLGIISNIAAIIITFFICGLWHGANYTFVVWGLLHAGFMVIGLILLKPKNYIYNKLGLTKSPLLKYAKIFITFNLISFAWIFFKADNMGKAFEVLSQIFTFMHIEVLPQFIKGYPYVAVLIIAAYLIHFLPEKLYTFSKNIFGKIPLPAKIILFAIVIYIAAQFKFSDNAPFLYFQF